MGKISYTLPDLPYAYDALEPVISKEIMTLHHDKHHAAYVNGANAALEKLEKARNGEIEIDHKAVMRDLSFNVSGHIMHTVFWMNMRPAKQDNKPGDKVVSEIESYFGSWDNFVKEFSEAAKKVEGSGWAVLGADENNNLMIYQVEKQNLMHMPGVRPILALDVWEHAYYLDYKNDRGAYVDAFWQIVNWGDVEMRLFGCGCCGSCAMCCVNGECNCECENCEANNSEQK